MSGMTDELALEAVAKYLGDNVYQHLADRLRGEAAQGERQAVAWAVTREGDSTFPRLYTREADADDMVNYVTLPPRPVKRPLVFADRPQPTPVVGEGADRASASGR